MSTEPHNTLRSPVAVSRFLFTVAIALGLDLWSKAAAVHHLAPQGPLDRPGVFELLPGFLHLTYVENHGAVFGIGQGMRWVFVAISIVAIGFLTYLLAHSGKGWFRQIVLGLLLAGVLGNLYDRFMFGYVRDMIHAVPGWVWPDGVRRLLPFLPREVYPWVFNLADSFLVMGVATLLLMPGGVKAADQPAASRSTTEPPAPSSRSRATETPTSPTRSSASRRSTSPGQSAATGTPTSTGSSASAASPSSPDAPAAGR